MAQSGLTTTANVYRARRTSWALPATSLGKSDRDARRLAGNNNRAGGIEQGCVRQVLRVNEAARWDSHDVPLRQPRP